MELTQDSVDYRGEGGFAANPNLRPHRRHGRCRQESEHPMTLITTTIPAPTAPRYRPAGVMRVGVDQDTQCPFDHVDAPVVTIVLTIGVGIIATATEATRWAHAGPGDTLSFDPTNVSLIGSLFGQLAIGILGVLAISAEYGTGTIRSSLAAVPNRPLFLAAKARRLRRRRLRGR